MESDPRLSSRHSAFEVMPLEGNPPFGAQVVGLKGDVVSDASVRAALRDLWIEKGVVIFRGVSGPDFQIEVSKCCGELIEHPTVEARTSRPELSRGHYRPDDGMIYEVNGELRGNWLPWHTDLLYKPWINRGGMLRPVILPSRLGTTGFMDKIASYEALPDTLKSRIEGLEVIYSFNFDFENQKFVSDDVRVVSYASSVKKIHGRSQDFPRVVHPMVFTHRDLGKKVLNIAPSNAIGICGMENDEGDALLREVLGYATDERRAYFHEWRIDDMVLWDNWRLLHKATGGPADEERCLERTTIEGDYGLGRLESDAHVGPIANLDG